MNGWSPCYSDMLVSWISACSAQYLYNVLAMVVHQVCGHEVNSFVNLPLQVCFAPTGASVTTLSDEFGVFGLTTMFS